MLSFRLTWLGGRAFLPVWNARSMMHIHNPKWVPTATFVITAQSSKDCTLMHLLRCIQLFCSVGNFKLRAEHIPGYSNMPADAVSRSHLKVFFKVPPQVHRHPTPIPALLWSFLSGQQPEWRSPAWRKWLRTSSQTASHHVLVGPTRSASQNLCSSATD